MARNTTTAASLREAARKQPTPPWSTSIEPPDGKAVIELISPDRLNPYLTACVGDSTAALALYRWNSDLAVGPPGLQRPCHEVVAPPPRFCHARVEPTRHGHALSTVPVPDPPLLESARPQMQGPSQPSQRPDPTTTAARELAARDAAHRWTPTEPTKEVAEGVTARR